MNNTVTGVILAGGMGRRMDGVDKGLVKLQDSEMVAWVIDVLKPNVEEVIINANRNLPDYKKFGVSVVADSLEGYQGPLAGFEAGLSAATTDWIYTCPCDSPMQDAGLLPHMKNAVIEQNAEIGVAFDGERTHPVFSMVRSDLLPSLRDYLKSGERKIDRWFEQHNLYTVDCSEYAASFANINTLEELQKVELQRVEAERHLDGN